MTPSLEEFLGRAPRQSFILMRYGVRVTHFYMGPGTVQCSSATTAQCQANFVVQRSHVNPPHRIASHRHRCIWAHVAPDVLRTVLPFHHRPTGPASNCQCLGPPGFRMQEVAPVDVGRPCALLSMGTTSTGSCRVSAIHIYITARTLPSTLREPFVRSGDVQARGFVGSPPRLTSDSVTCQSLLY